MARPSSLTPDVEARILCAVLDGNYRHVAAAAAGIHRNTLRNWEARGEAGEEPYAGFMCELQKAEATAEIDALAKVRAGAEGWQSKAWMLERRFASRWAARVKQQVAEELDALTSKLKASLDADTFARVIDVATREDSQAAGTDPRH